MEALLLELRHEQDVTLKQLRAIQTQCEALTDVAYGLLARFVPASPATSKAARLRHRQ